VRWGGAAFLRMRVGHMVSLPILPKSTLPAVPVGASVSPAYSSHLSCPSGASSSDSQSRPSRMSRPSSPSVREQPQQASPDSLPLLATQLRALIREEITAAALHPGFQLPSASQTAAHSSSAPNSSGELLGGVPVLSLVHGSYVGPGTRAGVLSRLVHTV